MPGDAPYTREEVEQLRDAPVERGRWCERCRTRVPGFADLDDTDEAELRGSLETKGMVSVVLELRARTGCSLAWATIWATHLNEHAAIVVTPCPHCGKPLRTPRARQCRFCRRRWFDSPLPSRGD